MNKHKGRGQRDPPLGGGKVSLCLWPLVHAWLVTNGEVQLGSHLSKVCVIMFMTISLFGHPGSNWDERRCRTRGLFHRHPRHQQPPLVPTFTSSGTLRSGWKFNNIVSPWESVFPNENSTSEAVSPPHWATTGCVGGGSVLHLVFKFISYFKCTDVWRHKS